MAMLDFEHDYRSRRRHCGDYDFHKANLLAALDEHGGHDFFAQVKPLALDMVAAIEILMRGLTTTPRHVHGDPKASNILFNDDKEAICLVDFDTLSKAGWSLEMADALRSWCNPYPEDVLDAHVDLARAEAALKGYGTIMRGTISRKETDELIKHTQAVSLCLAIRYLTDVLNESYFRYDSTRFNRAAEHQWLKAQAMYQLFMDFGRKEAHVSAMTKDLLLGDHLPQ
jgi:Ser/Thr protein kinase RdoA (MazF antagonist)